MRRDEALKILSSHKSELRQEFEVASLRLFGSVARDEAAPGSDIDILVSFSATPTFRRFMQLRFRLEEILGGRVDLVTESGLRERVRPFVEQDAIAVA
jgi:uncharacterized protein